MSVTVTRDEYLSIMDSDNSHIVKSNVAGCSIASGSTADKLYTRRQMAFDTFGSIFVSNGDNYKV